jgi:YfiH family protein
MWYAASILPHRHAFTGVAQGDFRPEAPGQADSAAALVAHLGGHGTLRMTTQVHGARVIDGADHVALAGDGADAIVSTEPGVVIAVRVADCVPILLAAPGAVAAVHAGWRGTAADVTREALAVLCARAGCRPEAVRAAIGPAICGACYEVGDEVRQAMARVVPGSNWRRGPTEVDLAEVNAAILRGAGVAVELLGICTRCGSEAWSHRRDGAAAGRQVGAIRL